MHAFRRGSRVEDQPILAGIRTCEATAAIMAGGSRIESQFAAPTLSVHVRTPFLTVGARPCLGAGDDASKTLAPADTAVGVESKNPRLESLLSSAQPCKANNLPIVQGRAFSRVETQEQEYDQGRTLICGLQWSPSKNRVFSSQTLNGKLLPSYSKSFSNDLLPVVAHSSPISEPPCSVPAILFHPQTYCARTAPTRRVP
jgi:hypothetical protein